MLRDDRRALRVADAVQHGAHPVFGDAAGQLEGDVGVPGLFEHVQRDRVGARVAQGVEQRLEIRRLTPVDPADEGRADAVRVLVRAGDEVFDPPP